MPELTKDPKLTIRDLLVANWNAANVSTITPRISTGWFNTSWGEPQIAIVEANEFPLSGGVTGFRGIESASGNPMKFMLGNVSVSCFAHDEDGTGINPRILIFEMSEEIKRIIKNNVYPGNDLCWLSWNGRREVVNPDYEPVLFYYDNTVTYLYEDRV